MTTNALARKQSFQFLNQNNAEHFLLALEETSLAEHFVVYLRRVTTGKRKKKTNTT